MLELRVEKIKQELPDAATFYLSETSGKKIRYRAGQFITLVFTHHREEIRRSYSLSSSPDENLLAITVKRVANGEISRFMLSKVGPGDILHAVEPAGKFTLRNPEDEKDILMFAAGSGIVPFYSQLKFALARPGKSRIILIYSNAAKNSVLFAGELDKLAALHPERLKIIHLLSSEVKRLNNDVAEKLVKENLRFRYEEADFYTCGPFEYMRMIRLTLLYMGFDAARIRKENFVLQTIPVAHAGLNFPPRNIRIQFAGEMHDIIVGENQSILQAALQHSIPLPYSCRTGDCSTCSAICKSGKVEMIKNNVLTDADLAAGWVLTCTGHPVSDNVVIEF